MICITPSISLFQSHIRTSASIFLNVLCILYLYCKCVLYLPHHIINPPPPSIIINNWMNWEICAHIAKNKCKYTTKCVTYAAFFLSTGTYLPCRNERWERKKIFKHNNNINAHHTIQQNALGCLCAGLFALVGLSSVQKNVHINLKLGLQLYKLAKWKPKPYAETK